MVLRNKLNLLKDEELEKAERTFVYFRMAELELSPMFGFFDKQHLQNVHKYLFQDLYGFAGVFRLETISKDGHTFPPVVYLESSADALFAELQQEKWLESLSFLNMTERLAHYMGEINALHPFREGNGRAQREFIRTLAFKNGYSLMWNKAPVQEIYDASVKAVHESSEHLVEIIRRCMDSEEPDQAKIDYYKALAYEE
jgi:cell filamentation protein